MITHFFPNCLTQPRRRWLYAIVEIVAIVVFAICAGVVFGERGFRLGITNPQMAQVTGWCLMALSVCLFTLAVCLKSIDRE